MDKLPSGAIPVDQFESELNNPVPEGSIPVHEFHKDRDSTIPEGAIPVDQFESETDMDGVPHQPSKYETPMQQLGTAAEGLAQGFAGPVATLAEMGLDKMGLEGFSPEDIRGRAEANPAIHSLSEVAGFGAGLFTGASEAGLAGKIAGRFTPEATTALGKIGASALNASIQSGLFQTGNEITKSLIGQGDPDHPVGAALANIGAAGLFGAGAGGLFGAGGQAISSASKALQAKNIGAKANDFLTGMGLASVATPKEIESYLAGDNSKWAKAGLKAYGALNNKITETVAGGILADVLPFGNDTWYERVGKDLGGSFLGAKFGPKIAEAVGPVIYKALGSGNPQGIENTVNYVIKAVQGQNKVSKGIDGLFNYGTSKAVDWENPSKNIDFLKDFISKGGMDVQGPPSYPQVEPQGLAQGGPVEVSDDSGGLAHHLPEQNMLLSAARTRVSNFLKANQPQVMNSGVPFGAKHKDPNKERQYDRILKLANSPLAVLNHVKEGTLLPQHVQAMQAMYPELYKNLSKGMMAKIVDKVHKNDPPPYKMRQSLSLFLGQDLDGSLSPQSIQAAQMVFLKQNMLKNQESKPGSLSKVGNNQMTAEQSRTRDLNK